jgi:predicted DCC family thiol-disulfide oxidoreductase YuxK
VIYDGQCGFCLRSLRVCRALDWRGRLRFHDAHDHLTIAAQFPELAAADLDHAMYAVAEDRRTFRGFFAVRRIAWEAPLLWLTLPLLYLPGAGHIGSAIYAWIARHRHRLGCDTELCALPATPPAPPRR